jgi:polyphosphate kinase
VAGDSDRNEVVSIVDRYLEHARIYAFHNAGDEEVYLSSADWMTRNLDKRVELLFPVDGPEHKRKVLTALDAMFRDTAKAWTLGPDGGYRRKTPPPGEAPFRVQQWLQDEARRTVAAAQERAGVTLQPQTTDN